MYNSINIKDIDKESVFLHYTNKDNIKNIFKVGLLPKIGKSSKNIELNKKVFFTEGFDNTLTFIYNYVTGDTKEVDESEMIRELIKPSQLSYWYTPMVIYIMQNKYSSYFTAIS